MKILDEKLLKENIEKRMEKDIAECKVKDVAICVYQNDKIIYENFFGDVKENSLFRLASMTKPVTSVAVGILIDRGLLSLDDRLEKYLPKFHNLPIETLDKNGELKTVGIAKTPITIRHLLSHTSGIGSMDAVIKQAEKMSKEDDSTLDKACDFYATQGLAFEPYTKESYSPVWAFDILAKIVELLSGQDFQSFVHENICVPCEMKDTTFVPTQEQWSRLITLHARTEDGQNAVGKTTEGCVFGDTPTTHILGGAGLIASMGDYLNFATMLLHNGVFNGKRVVSEEYVKEMHKYQVDKSIMPYCVNWGLGVLSVADETYARREVGSYGWSGAYGTHFWVDDVNRIVAIYMKNSTYDGGSGAVTASNFEIDVTSALK